MKKKILTFVNLLNKDNIVFKKCINSQKEWAEFHGLEFNIYEYSEHENKGSKEWNFYNKYIDFILDKADDPDCIYIAITPYTLILNKYINPFDVINTGGLHLNSIDFPSIYATTVEDNEFIRMTLEHSKLYSTTPKSHPRLALNVIDCKIRNYIYEIDNLHIGFPFVQGVSTGMEIHLDTFKDGSIGPSYTPKSIDDDAFYKVGDFAVNVLSTNINLTKGFITEFSHMKKRIDTVMRDSTSLIKDLKIN